MDTGHLLQELCRLDQFQQWKQKRWNETMITWLVKENIYLSRSKVHGYKNGQDHGKLLIQLLSE